MSTKTETHAQTALAIKAGDEDTKNEEEHNSLHLLCYCGQLMIKTNAKIRAPYCNSCSFKFTENSNDEYYSCPIGKKSPHENGYDLCLKCSHFKQNCNKNPIQDIHQIEMLHFVYNNDEVIGPYTQNEIITLYVAQKLDKHKIHVMEATKEGNWIKLEFPKEYFSELAHNDKKRCNKMEECEKINAEFKKKFPELYSSLIEDVFNAKLKQVTIPQCLPLEAEKSSLPRRCIKLLGQILSVCIVIIMILHCLPALILTCIFGCILCC
eukprot:88983_1